MTARNSPETERHTGENPPTVEGRSDPIVEAVANGTVQKIRRIEGNRPKPAPKPQPAKTDKRKNNTSSRDSGCCGDSNDSYCCIDSDCDGVPDGCDGDCD